MAEKGKIMKRKIPYTSRFDGKPNMGDGTNIIIQNFFSDSNCKSL
jgi:hypothetical protein